MLKKPPPPRTELEVVTPESLVPVDHLPRKIAEVIGFGFIDRARCQPQAEMRRME